ncbi:glycosyltransferase family 39 protein [Mycobacterium sp. EPa45]|uniref:ArnT family glycosyltransferase n=1 Tax=Mycobacterium sp. EPa45 TaxID=1545728 RepID=UPI000641D909|nr:glycosyltransferase family 39 protein [Mycobacterium sp. EPa45]AKK29857.1 glycosyl transferase [Mycobacterium sp. EPa45]
MTVLAEFTERPTDIQPHEQPSSLRPRWVRPALGLLLAVTAVLYLWGLDAAGWANDYYAAAVQAGTQSWKALLFGSLDAGNAITVDKPPAALWVMALSGRVFGFGTLSMLVPQALMGVASVALIYGAVRRVSGYGAGLLAGAVLALTPVAALMFRFNNPDALLVLLMVVAAYCVVRALDANATRWIALAGVAIGFAFLAKLLQALLVTPAFALVVLVAVPGSVWLRLHHIAVGLIAIVLSAGWYLALVSLWPSDSRPYIGGSTDNSLLQLALGYNGLGRVFGGDGNPGGSSSSGAGEGGGPGGGMFGGSTGIARMFDTSMGTEISWLLPAALIGLVAGLWFTRRAPRTDRTRAALLLWGGWLLVTAAVFSFMKGIMHPYYTIALAPAIAAVIGISVRELWRGKQFVSSRVVLGAILVTTGVWNFILLDRTPEWLPWLRWVVLAGSIAVTAVFVAGGHRLGRWTATLAAAGLLFGLGATAAYTVETVAGSHTGPIPTSGPARADGGMGFGGPGGPGGQQASDNTELKTMLTQADNRWAAATIGSMSTSPLELATGKSIMSIGGFSGGDNAPTLEQFQNYVATGQVHYFIVGSGPGGGHHGGPGGDSGPGTQITKWVQQHFTAQDIGGTEVYDLNMPN